jgi:hypothetical protein
LVDVKNIDWNVPKAELDSFIDSNYEGLGITTKATVLVIDYLRAPLKTPSHQNFQSFSKTRKKFETLSR